MEVLYVHQYRVEVDYLIVMNEKFLYTKMEIGYVQTDELYEVAKTNSGKNNLSYLLISTTKTELLVEFELDLLIHKLLFT